MVLPSEQPSNRRDAVAIERLVADMLTDSLHAADRCLPPPELVSACPPDCGKQVLICKVSRPLCTWAPLF